MTPGIAFYILVRARDSPAPSELLTSGLCKLLNRKAFEERNKERGREDKAPTISTPLVSQRHMTLKRPLLDSLQCMSVRARHSRRFWQGVNKNMTSPHRRCSACGANQWQLLKTQVMAIITGCSRHHTFAVSRLLIEALTCFCCFLLVLAPPQ